MKKCYVYVKTRDNPDQKSINDRIEISACVCGLCPNRYKLKAQIWIKIYTNKSPWAVILYFMSCEYLWDFYLNTIPMKTDSSRENNCL